MLVIALCACHREIGDRLAPTTRIEAPMGVPAHDHAFEVIVGITVPLGMELQYDPPVRVFHLTMPHDGDPRITVTSTLIPPSWGFGYEDEPHPVRPSASSPEKFDEAPGSFEHCMPPQSTIAMREPRPDGEVIVCSRRDEPGLYDTVVTRDIHWRDPNGYVQQFECAVNFTGRREQRSFHSRDGSPSAARLGDAKAICDSVSVRSATDADLLRFFPPGSEVRRLADPSWYLNTK